MKDDPCEFPPVVLNYGPEPDPILVASYIAQGMTPQQAYEKAQGGLVYLRPKKEWMP